MTLWFLLQILITVRQIYYSNMEKIKERLITFKRLIIVEPALVLTAVVFLLSLVFVYTVFVLKLKKKMSLVLLLHSFFNKYN